MQSIIYGHCLCKPRSTFDTSSVGAQNITYTANADAAGNTPDPINRTVTVLAKPIALGALTIVSDNANTLYAKLVIQLP